MSDSKKRLKEATSSTANSKAQARQHYATFTNDLQAQRMAALQASAKEIRDEEEAESSFASRISGLASSVSDGITGVFRSVVFQVSSACLPCFEILAAFNLLPFGRSAKAAARRGKTRHLNNDEDSVSVGTIELENGSASNVETPIRKTKRSNSASSATKTTGRSPSPPVGSPPSAAKKKPAETSYEMAKRSIMLEQGRVASEVALGSKAARLLQKAPISSSVPLEEEFCSSSAAAERNRSFSNSSLDISRHHHQHKRPRNYGMSSHTTTACGTIECNSCSTFFYISPVLFLHLVGFPNWEKAVRPRGTLQLLLVQQ